MTKNTQKSNGQSGKPKASKRSVLGYMFNPDLGLMFSPMLESTRMFLHLLAMVFSIYRLLPKDYPGLHDPKARMSLHNIIGTAWQNLRFTPEDVPRIILFFAILGLLVGGVLTVFLFILSLFFGQAHAAGNSIFTPPDENTDLAYKWIKFIFLEGDYPNGGAIVSGSSGLQNPFDGSSVGGLQTILPTLLAYYSDAILIAAAIILFYYLTSMVVETAHDGVAMGKRANQVWAPIRLVVAVGLLVPINGGLNSGQYIVIKMAEYGSGLATNMWNLLLDVAIAKDAKLVPPSGPASQTLATNIIMMEACQISWNKHIDDLGLLASLGHMVGPVGKSTLFGSRKGTKYSYSFLALVDVDICGSYFIPDSEGNTILDSAITVYKGAIDTLRTTTAAAGGAAYKIKEVDSDSEEETVAALDTEFMNEIAAFQKTVNNGMAALLKENNSEIKNALLAMKPAGWVMAGAYLNTINRVQAYLNQAVTDSTPSSSAPLVGKYAEAQEEKKTDLWSQIWAGIQGSTWDVRKKVAQDMQGYGLYQAKSATNNATFTDNETAQCASMVGYSTDMFDWKNIGVGFIFGAVDALATTGGFWSGDDGHNCGTKSGLSTFSLGVRFNGQDPFAQMSFLGHAAFSVASLLLTLAIGTQTVAAALTVVPAWNMGLGIQGLMQMISPLLYFIAWLFWTMGFTLSFLVPLMPFMRFFFSVLSWLAGLVEAVVAVPLVALAHLNPEGDGLPGQAKSGYFFVFNLFLRPVLTVFGLILASILFLIAVSFLNYGYTVAIAGSGGTAFGLRAVSRVIYSILYVVTLYIAGNNLFKLVDHIPEHALSWMGQNAQAMLNIGDYEDVESTGAAVSSYAGKQGMDAAQQAGSAATSAMKSKSEKKLADKEAPVNTLQSLANQSGKTYEEYVDEHEDIVKDVFKDPKATKQDAIKQKEEVANTKTLSGNIKNALNNIGGNKP